MITPSYGLTATERVLPKLALDWTTGLVQPGVDVVRAGVATFVGSNGLIQSASANTQRIDYTTGVAGLLVEESRINLSLNSEDFSAGTYNNINATISTDVAETVAPDGTNTADKYILPNGIATGSSAVRQGFTKSASAITYTLSVFAKKAENNTIRLIFRDSSVSGNNASANFNLNTKTIATAATAAGTFTNASASITELTNDWFKVTLTATTGTETGIDYRLLQLLNNANTTGNDVNGIYIWGVQLEVGAFPTSYIPTTTTSVTRNADVATMTGTNFSDFFNATEGTFFAQTVTPSGMSGNTNRLLSVNDGTTSNRIEIDTGTASNTTVLRINATTNQGVITVAGPPSYATRRSVFAYKQDAYALAVNGDALGEDTSANVGTFDRLSVGSSFATSSSYANGLIQKVMYWPHRLTNAEIQAFSK